MMLGVSTVRRLIDRAMRYRQRAIGYYPVTIHGVPFRVDPYNVDFWRSVDLGRWEPHTFDILDAFLTPTSTYWDVGSWIGPTAIYASKRCRQVTCFEPDPTAYRFLCWNVELNGLKNVDTYSVALAADLSVRTMTSFGGSRGDSMTSLINTHHDDASVRALVCSWHDIYRLTNPGRIGFIKIDIEGGEFELLPSMHEYLAEHRPVIYLSTHLPFLAEQERAGSVRKLLDALSMYTRCLDERLQPTPTAELLAPEHMNAFRSYVFTHS